MSTLSTSILELGFTSERDMEEALARQVMYGGDLGSNLLELGMLTEEQLVEACAHSTGLSTAPIGELPPTPDGLTAVLSLDLQRRHRLHVLGEEEGQLVVAVFERLPPQVEAELATASKRLLRQVVAPWVRIEQALARAQGRPPSERAHHLLKRLEGRASAAPLGPTLSVDFKRLPRPESVPPIDFTEVARDFDVSTGPPPEGYVELTQSQAAPPRVDTPGDYVRAHLDTLPPLNHRRGPYTAAAAERDLLEAGDRHQVLSAFFDFCAQYFEYTALFVIKGGAAVGYRGRGAGAPSERVRAIHVALDLPSAFSRAREERTWLLTRLRAGGIEGGLARDLGRPAGKKVLVLPLLVKGRPVSFLYGDHGRTDVDLASVGDVLSFAPLASAALERTILKRKAGGRLPQFASLRPRPSHSLPSRDEQARAFVQLLSQAPAPPPVAAAPAPANHEPLRNDTRSWSRYHSSNPPFPSQAPGTLPGIPAPPLAGPTLPSIDLQLNKPLIPTGKSPESGSIPARPTVSLEPEPTDRTGSVPRGEAPPPALGEEPPEDGWDIDSTFDEQESGTAAGVGKFPRGASISSRPTARMSQPPAPQDTASLVERLCEGDETALDALLQAGEMAIAALVARFPGPLPGVASKDRIDKASACGPVLNALARLGSQAIPYLTVRTADEDAHVREWATRLLGELPSRESAQAVARRMVDDSPSVRRAALAAARMSQRVPEAREGTRIQLEELAGDAALPATVRRAAIEALTDLREPRAVPCMVQLLADGHREVAGAARWSLVVLTRQDFGSDQDYWSRFWTANGSRHRIEWLIDSLTHDNRDIRRAAGDELKNITKEYFGYYDDLPESERKRVQERYREWWSSEGQTRFRATTA